MSEEKFMRDLNEFIAEHPDEGKRVFVEIDSVEMLGTFNAELSAVGRKCKRVAINPHTGEMKCLEWE